jgi:predicted regulator of Ras-like GTPase activity (Roadblock/LC7/MglB family)
MKAPAPADLQRWSEDVARDPASLSFLPLARMYRKQGRRDAALKLCLRGLEHHPTHVEAHALLAMLYFEGGQRSKAYDEWSMVLRLEPDNFEALRGMGFYHLEQGDDASALRSLQRAGALKPSDLSVQEALKLIHEKTQAAAAAGEYTNVTATPAGVRDAGTGYAPVGSAGDVSAPESTKKAGADVLMPWEEPEPIAVSKPSMARTAASPPPPAPSPLPPPPLTPPVYTPPPQFAAPARPSQPPQWQPAPIPTPAAQPSAMVPPMQASPAAPAPQAAGTAELPSDPSRLFDSVVKGQILGALLLDAQGLVLAGNLSGETGDRAEALGALLGGAIEEAARTSSHLALGGWKGILIEAEQALLHLAPVSADTILLLAAKRETPAGWMLRSANQARALAARFLEVYA